MSDLGLQVQIDTSCFLARRISSICKKKEINRIGIIDKILKFWCLQSEALLSQSALDRLQEEAFDRKLSESEILAQIVDEWAKQKDELEIAKSYDRSIGRL